LLSEPLVIKRGGHPDQLSRSIWGMDRYRVVALQKLLRGGLDGKRREAAVQVLRQKLAILANGARKRGKIDQAEKFEGELADFDLEEAGEYAKRPVLHNEG
jgi:hypothetical protein